jgi:outer membrane biosynthesis protein TonB
LANDRISKRKPEKKKKKKKKKKKNNNKNENKNKNKNEKKNKNKKEKDNRVVSFSRAPVRALGYAALGLALLVRPDAGVEVPAGQPKQFKQAM